MGANDAREQLAVAVQEYNVLEQDYESLRLTLARVRDARRKERVGLVARINELRARLAGVDVHDVELLRAEAKAEHRRWFTAETARDEYRAERDALAARIAEAVTYIDAIQSGSFEEIAFAQAGVLRALEGADTDAALREVRARAVEDAADQYASGRLTGIFMGRDDYAKAWMRHHADAIREGRA